MFRQCSMLCSLWTDSPVAFRGLHLHLLSFCFLCQLGWRLSVSKRNELCMSCHAEIDLIWMLRPATGTG